MAVSDSPNGGTPTIRRSSCAVLIPSTTKSDCCQQCQVFQSSLRSCLSKLNQHEEGSTSKADPISHTPYRCLSRDELTSRLRQLKKVHTRTVRRLHELESKLEVSITQSGVYLDQSTHDDLLAIMEKKHSSVAAEYPPDSFPCVL